jgi:hypothetical protein
LRAVGGGEASAAKTRLVTLSTITGAAHAQPRLEPQQRAAKVACGGKYVPALGLAAFFVAVFFAGLAAAASLVIVTCTFSAGAAGAAAGAAACGSSEEGAEKPVEERASRW